jgi:hypothetical protein
MGTFIYIGHDGPRGEELRKIVRDRHIASLEGLEAQGRIVYAGPLRDASGKPSGSVIIFEAEDLATAKELAKNDPYTSEGVFERVDVYESMQVFPRTKN